MIVEYEDLTSIKSVGGEDEGNKVLMEKLERAFGPDGTGIIGIRNVPGFLKAKKELLPLAYPLAHLPHDDLRELEDPNSLYNAGWSHGREKLKANIPDMAKGSFYFNPVVDIPGTPEDRERYPVSYPQNLWPKKSLPKLEPAAKQLGCLMKDVAVILSKHIDAYAHSCNQNYPLQTLYNTLVDTEKVKGRLLYYYPLPESAAESEDSWIGWHNDSGFLTALAGDIYMNPSGDIIKESSSPSAGLYVVDRGNQVKKVNLPDDCMAIQIGECTQIITGGAVVATPHCVKGAPNLARVSLACFIDTPPSAPLSVPPGFKTESDRLNSSPRVPSLKARWTNGMTFGDFLQTTFQMYYDWNK